MTEARTLCVNRHRYFHSFSKRELHCELELLAWLEAQDFEVKGYFQGRDGIEVALLGCVLMLSEVPEFDRGNDSPAKFWGGHKFFPKLEAKSGVWEEFPSCAFFLPQFEVRKHGTKIEVIANSINSPLKDALAFYPTYFTEKMAQFEEPEHLPSAKNWKELVEESLKKIQSKTLDKVVMARCSSFETSANPLEMLSNVKSEGQIRFALQFKKGSMFIGATPERLYRRIGTTLLTEAIAGTAKLGRGQELLTDAKQLNEFRFVKRSIEMALSELCEKVELGEEDVIQTPKVEHLHSAICAELKGGVTDAKILSALHPTAAMGGLPKKSALEYLALHEPFERGWYASPIGFISPEEAEFAVGIRSCLVQPKKLHLFAGAGIVEGSRAEKEWEELNHKTALWREG